MTIQPGASLYTQGFGSRPENVEVPVIQSRDPTSTDIAYPIGKQWNNSVSGGVFFLGQLTTSGGVTSATWVSVTAGSGAVNTINSLPPSAGNITIAGTAGSISVANGGSTVTIATAGPYTPTTYTAHGVIVGEGTGNLVALSPGVSGQVLVSAGAGADPAFGSVGVPGGGTGAGSFTAHGVLIGEGTSPIVATSVGATGTVFVGHTGADPSFTASPSVTGSITAGTGITSTTGNIVATAGAVNAGSTITAATGITATTGAITATAGNFVATNGNVIVGTPGNKLLIATGANASIGTSAAMVAGTVIVATTAVTAGSIIFLTANTPGGTQGTLSAPSASIIAGTSFVINSSNAADTSTVNWWIIN